MPSSLFITFEGTEGCGKSTQIALLEQYLKSKGVSVKLTREPGGTPTANAIRSILLDSKNKEIKPLTELLLYTASRAQHVEELIQPSLLNHQIVLCDRFTDATLAYQGYGRGLDLKLIDNLNKMATQGLTPHKTFLFNLDPAIGLKRALDRNAQATTDEGRFENEKLEFHKKVQAGYLALAKNEPHRFEIIDASGSKETIHQMVIQKIEALLA
ncbi:dTMP kinase [bacterium]|nr:dTMP kinase [bacterium]